MNFGNIGFMEILIILLIVLLLFGARRLPEIGASMGKGIREFKRSISDVNKSLTESEPDRSERVRAADAPPARVRDEDEKQPEPKRLLS
jgi:sec-independent protein translocase protein TatA